MTYLRVKNLEKYQHYKDRNPPWLKLYRSSLGDYDLRQISIAARLCFHYLSLLASETDNRVPNDTVFLSERMGFKVTELIINELIERDLVLAVGARRLLAHDAPCSSLLSSSEESPLLSSLSSSESSPKKKSVLKTESSSGETWIAYQTAFKARYGVDPVRNAKTNGMMAQFVKRIPVEEAPAVAAFYCTHNAALYVRAKHCIDLLLRDAEGLRMEWATGRQITNGHAAMEDRTSTTGAIVSKLIAEERAKDEPKPA